MAASVDLDSGIKVGRSHGSYLSSPFFPPPFSYSRHSLSNIGLRHSHRFIQRSIPVEFLINLRPRVIFSSCISMICRLYSYVQIYIIYIYIRYVYICLCMYVYIYGCWKMFFSTFLRWFVISNALVLTKFCFPVATKITILISIPRI